MLAPLSLIQQISRGTASTGNESDVEMIAANKVDGMTKIIMASTADAWLINLPGISRRYEVLTQGQYDNDTSTVREIMLALTGTKSKDAPTSHGFPTSLTGSSRKSPITEK